MTLKFMDTNSDIVFIHIPKCAGGTIKTWFRKNDIKLHTSSHTTLDDIVCRDNLTDFTSFTIVRNSYRRMVSLYNWIPKKAEKMIKKNRNVEHWTEQLEWHGKGIEPWFEYLHENNDVETQLDYIQGVDIIIDQENLKKDFSKIQDLTNCYTPLEDIKIKHKTYYNYKNTLTPRLINLIDNYYYKEIELFDYKP